MIFLIAAVTLTALFALIGSAVAPRGPTSAPLASRMALGFAVFVFLCVFPLYFVETWAVTLACAMALALLGLRRFRWRRPANAAEIVFWSAFLLNLLLLAWGTAKNPGLGDHDPYEHAMAASWLYETANIFPPAEIASALATLDPYPPGYDAAASAISSVAGGVANGLRIWAIVSAAMFPLAVRFFARAVGFSARTAAIAGAVCVLLPPAPTHFAWTHTAAFPLTLVGAGALALCARNWRWLVPAAVALAAYGFTATSEIIYGVFLFLPVAWRIFSEKRSAFPLAAVGLSLALFSGWGVHVAKKLSEGEALKPPAHYFTLRAHYNTEGEGRPWYNKHRGNARPYGADEFFVPRRANNFNIPVGLPAAVTIGALAGFYFLWRRKGIVWPAALFAFFLVAVQGERLPVEFFPHRAWTYLALLCAIGFAHAAVELLRRKKTGDLIAAALAVFALASFAHSGWVRARVELAPWGNEIFTGDAQRDGYYGLPSVLRNEKAWPVTGGIRHGYVSAFGGRSLFWGGPERSADSAFEKGDVSSALKSLEEAGYRHLILDSTADLRFGEGAANRIGQGIMTSGRWRIADRRDAFALFRLE